MQKHPMLSVKEAAEALKIDERSVRDRLANGTLKGEKKQVGLRDKWFVYASAINSALAKQGDMNFIGNSMTVQEGSSRNIVDTTSIPVSEVQETVDATYGELDDITLNERAAPSRGDWHPETKANLESLVETFMKPLVEKVATQERALLEQAALVAQQEKVIEEQKLQLRLLPDLQRRAEQEAEAAKAAELKLYEAAALRKQAEEERNAAQLKALEAEALNKQLAALRAQQEESAKAKQQVAELEQTLVQRQQESEAEIQKLKLEKEAQLKAVAEQLAALNQTVEELKKPWWKKLLGSSKEPS